MATVPLARRPAPMTIAELVAAAPGSPVGTSRPFVVEQQAIDGFAEITGDRQWIHVDPERAKEGPFGGTIAHGFLTLAMVSRVLDEVVSVVDAGAALNYGLNRVRFPASLHAGVAVLGDVTLAAKKEITGGVEVTWSLTLRTPGGVKPVCAAEMLVRYLSGTTGGGRSSGAATRYDGGLS